MSVDVLVLSLGTTRGLRIADAQLVGLLEAAGASVSVTGVRIGLGDRLRRGYPINDLVEAAAARRAVGTALRRIRPRSVIFSTTTASLLAGASVLDGVRFGIWLDSPARLNRPGFQNAVLWGLEARRMASAAVVMPLCGAALEALPAGVRRAVVVPIPVTVAATAPSVARDPLVVAYTPDPKAKDIELVVRAWQRFLELEREPGSDVACVGARLAICGIAPDWAREFLRRRGLAELPPRIDLAGMVPAPAFRALLARAAVYLSGARWEDFGQTRCRRWRGAAMVAAPGGGPFPALALARELEPRFVSADRSPESLAGALARGLSPFDRRRYQGLARAALGSYRADAVVATLRGEVLPLLLS